MVINFKHQNKMPTKENQNWSFPEIFVDGSLIGAITSYSVSYEEEGGKVVDFGEQAMIPSVSCSVHYIPRRCKKPFKSYKRRLRTKWGNILKKKLNTIIRAKNFTD